MANVKTITDAIWSGSRSFEYDDLNRLKQATGTFGLNQALVTHDYNYDAIGNILTKAGISYCYGYMAACTDVNRPSAVKSTSDLANYNYDDNGNITSGAGRTYVWNGDNRLDQVSGPGGSAVMTYDYTGIRIQKSGSSGTTYFPFMGYEVQGGTVTKFIRIGNEILASKQSASTKRFYHNDHLGGVNIISDINAAKVQLTEYDPWGKVSRSDGLGDPTHRFTGQELDSESNIHYYGGRYYDQALARFISPDPFVQEPDNPQNLNRYSYVINNPQNYIDPSGYDYTQDDYTMDLCIGSGCSSSYGSGDFSSGSNISSGSTINVSQMMTNYNQVELYQNSGSGLANFFSVIGVTITTGGIGGLQSGLDIAGFFPGIGTFANLGSAGISLYQGDFYGAAGATLAAVPVVGQVGKLGGAAAKGLRLSEKLPKALQGGEALTHVYKGMRDNLHVYSGITIDMIRRQTEHAAKYVLREITPAVVSRGQARAIEQALIVRNRGENIRNSISPIHEYYDEAVKWGKAWLKAHDE